MSYQKDLADAQEALREVHDTGLMGIESVIDGTSIRGYIIVATVSDQEPTLYIYRNQDLVKLWRTAKADADTAEEFHDFFAEAVWEYELGGTHADSPH